MIELAINDKYAGPTLTELIHCLDDIEDKFIKVRWLNSRAEFHLLERLKDKNFILYVPDLTAMERAAIVLGKTFLLDKNVLDTAKIALLSKKNYNWRQLNTDVGTPVARSLITRLSAESIRAGYKPKLAYVAKDCILDNVNPIDADVLVRLRILRGY